MSRYRVQRRQPGLSILGDEYRCDEIDKYMELHNLQLQGLDAHVIGPKGYEATLTVSYPIPRQISVPMRLMGTEKNVTVNLTEVWIEYDKEKLFPFVVYELRARNPSASIKVEH